MAQSVGAIALDVVMGKNSVTGVVSQTFKDVEKVVSNAESSISAKVGAMGTAFTNVGSALLPLSASVGAFGVSAGKMAMDFEDSMASIATLLNDTKDLKKYEKAVMDFSRETGLSLENVSSGMYQAISSVGDMGDETIEIFEVMGKAAKAGGAEVSDSVALISAGAKGYGDVTVEMSEKIADLAFQTTKLGVTTFPELASSMAQLFPLGSALNVKIEDLFGTMATLTGVTGNTAEVSTQLKNVMAGMAKPTGEMQKLMESYGYSTGAAMIENEGLFGVMEIVREATGGQADQLNKLFSSQEAVVAVTALSGEQFEVYRDKLDAMTNSTGAMSDAFEIISGTTGDKMRVAMNEISVVMTDLGGVLLDLLLPTLKILSGAISAFADWWSGLGDGTKKVIAGFVLVTAAIAPVLIIVGKFLMLMSAVPAMMAGITAGAGVLATAIGFISWPVVAVIAAVAGLIAIGWALWKNWDQVTNFFKENWQTLLAFIINPFAGAFKLCYEHFDGFREFVDGFIGNFKQIIQGGFDSIGLFFSETIPQWINFIGQWFNELPGKIGYAIGQSFANIVNWGAECKTWFETNIPIWINTITTYFSELPGKIWGHLTTAFDNVVNWGSNMWAKANEIGSTFVTNLITWVQELPGKMTDIGTNIVTGLWQGIQNGWEWFKTKIGEFSSNIVSGFKENLDIHSPSRVMEDEVGVHTGDGVFVGMKKSILTNAPLVADLFKEKMTIANEFAVESPKITGQSVANVSRETSDGNGLEKVLQLLMTMVENVGGDQITQVILDGNVIDEFVNKKQKLNAYRAGGVY